MITAIIPWNVWLKIAINKLYGEMLIYFIIFISHIDINTQNLYFATWGVIQASNETICNALHSLSKMLWIQMYPLPLKICGLKWLF